MSSIDIAVDDLNAQSAPNIRATVRNTEWLKFCFFIDGLDEYDGDHREVIYILRGFTRSENFKICLSSRPWNVFEVAFGQGRYPTIRLEDLTREDIEIYVRSNLEENELFYPLQEREPERSDQVVYEVVDKAQGVFLWVFLVVRSLIHGLTNADRITDLRRRLRRLPGDLETYFQHMLGPIDDTYRKQTARTFKIALQASEPFTLMIYAMLDELEENPTFALDLTVQEMNGSEIKLRYDEMILRINARCKDLLEVTKVKDYSTLPTQSEKSKKTKNPKTQDPTLDDTRLDEVKPRGSLSSNSFFLYEVDFLHRTAQDFFQIRYTQDMIAENVGEDFNADQLLCQAFLAQIKKVPLKSDDLCRTGPFSDLVDDMVHYAHELEEKVSIPQTKLLDELSNAIASRNQSLPITFTCATPLIMDPSLKEIRYSFLSFSVQRNLQLYVTEKLCDRHEVVENYGRLIACAMKPSINSKYGVGYDHKMAYFLANRVTSKIVKGEEDLWPIVIRTIRTKWYLTPKIERE